MECTAEGCRTLWQLDLQRNKKQAWLVNGIGFALLAGMFLLMCLALPFQMMRWGMEQVGVILWLGLLLAAAVLCGFLLALLRKLTLPEKPEGFSKGSYILRALLPMVTVGILLMIGQVIVPVQWCWFVYLIQMINVAGAAQELFVAVRLLFLPKDITVFVEGAVLSVSSRE